MTKTDVSVKNSSDVPDYLKGVTAPKTKDNFDSSDVVMPRVKLIQGTSEELTSQPLAALGEFWHTGADIPLGQNFKFVILSRRKYRLLMAPLEDGQGVLARADDFNTWDRLGSWEVKIDKKTKVTWTISDLNVEASGLTEWGSSDPTDSDSPPAATVFYEYLVMLPDHMELGPVVISLARSAIKNAKKGLNDKIAMRSGAGQPLQAQQYTASSYTDNNGTNEYKNWRFAGAGFVDEGVYKAAVKAAETFTDYKVQDEEGAVDDKPVAADSDKY